MAVTSDNKLLLCNYSDKKVYIYKDYKTYEDEISLTSQPWCITVVPCTDKAVFTLPDERSIQFTNTPGSFVCPKRQRTTKKMLEISI
jgi:hypothetical protein